jgi:hypothetical protein
MIIKLEADDMGTPSKRNGLHLTVCRGDQNVNLLRYRSEYCLGVPFEKRKSVW